MRRQVGLYRRFRWTNPKIGNHVSHLFVNCIGSSQRSKRQWQSTINDWYQPTIKRNEVCGITAWLSPRYPVCPIRVWDFHRPLKYSHAWGGGYRSNSQSWLDPGETLHVKQKDMHSTMVVENIICRPHGQQPLSLNKLLLPISGSRCVVSGGKWSKIVGIWGWGCWMLGHGPPCHDYVWWANFSCTLERIFFSCGNLFNLLAHVEKIRVSVARLSIGDAPTLTPCTPQSTKRKKGISYPSFEAQCQSDTENEFVSTKSQPEWISYAVARLTGRSWNRRVQIVKSPRIREAPGGRGRRIAVWANKRRIGRSSAKVKSTRLEY